MSLSRSIRKRHNKDEQQNFDNKLDNNDVRNDNDKTDSLNDDKIISYSRSSTVNQVNLIVMIKFRKNIKMTKNLLYQKSLLLANVVKSQTNRGLNL